MPLGRTTGTAHAVPWRPQQVRLLLVLGEFILESVVACFARFWALWRWRGRTSMEYLQEVLGAFKKQPWDGKKLKDKYGPPNPSATLFHLFASLRSPVKIKHSQP